MNPLISFVFSFRNEEAVLPALFERLEKVLFSLPVTYELIFVNDASTDASLEILKRKAASDPRVRVLTTSRRYGVVPCLLAGMKYAGGDAVITMDADLQDPPEVIPLLLQRWREGAELVSTLRSRRLGESQGKMLLTRCAYYFLNFISLKVNLPVEAGDFRLLSRAALEKLLESREKYPYLRGLVQTLGVKQAFVPYVREKRFSGETHFPLLSRGPVETFMSGLIFCGGTTPWVLMALLVLASAILVLGGWRLILMLGTSPQSFPWGIPLLMADLGILCFLLTAFMFLIFKICRESSQAPSYCIQHIINDSKITEPQNR